MKKLMEFGLSLIVLFLFICYASAVGINEVSPETPEFVEIYNENNEFLNLSEWKIRDNYNIDEVTCYNITNCSLLINFSYFIIIGRNTNISEITSKQINYFYVDDATIGNGLASNDNVTFFNSTFSTSFSWNNSGAGKSWQFYNGSWQQCKPTPGSINSCTQQPQNNSQNPPQNKSQQNNTNDSQETSIYLKLDWDEDDIVNGEEFEIKVEAFNLKNENYDIKIYITFEDENTIISETYNEEDDKWKSSTYYVENIISGSGDKSATLSLRIKSSYRNFSGDAEVIAKIRKSGTSSIIDEVREDIEILEKEEENNTSKIIETQKTSKTSKTVEENDKKTAQITGEVIKLGNRQAETKDEKENVLYESGSEKIKKYAIYGLNLILIVIVIFLLKRKGFKTEFAKE